MSRVLLLADDQELRSDIELELRRNQHIVRSRGMGEFIAGDVREFEPDVFIMDLAGNSACAPARLAMLRDPSLAKVPLVAVATSAEEARAYGAQAYLARPLHPADVTHVVDALVRPLLHPLLP